MALVPPDANMNTQDLTALFEDSEPEEVAPNVAVAAAAKSPECELCGSKPEVRGACSCLWQPEDNRISKICRRSLNEEVCVWSVILRLCLGSAVTMGHMIKRHQLNLKVKDLIERSFPKR